jgi:serine/threonine protein kinase
MFNSLPFLRLAMYNSLPSEGIMSTSSGAGVATQSVLPLEIRKGFELHGRYVFSDFLGSGGFATVWRATDKQENRDVAIKRLLRKGAAPTPKEELQRFLEEARRTAQLKGNKNIVEVFEAFEESGDGFIVMEYIDGKSLDALLREYILKKTWLPVDEALDYFKQMLEGLVFAHSCGVYHRDIKPSNIIVSKLGVVKLVDFGLAKPMPFSPVAAGPLYEGFAGTGTPAFMSYEQARGEALDHHTDIFSAGMIGYLLLTRRHPFNHPSGVFSIVDLIREPVFACDELPQIAGVADGVRRLIMRMLTKDRAQRCHSLMEPITELTKELAQLCSRCGAENRASHKFCSECGAPFRGAGIRGDALPESAEDQAEALTDEGFDLTKSGDWEGAIAKYKQAIDVDRTYGRAYVNLGFAYNRLSNYGESIEILTKGIEVCKQDRSLLHRLLDNRGFARANRKSFVEAIRDFDEAIRHNANNPRVFYHRAEAKAEMGMLDEAYSDVLKALELEPFFTPAERLKARLESRKFGTN